MDKLSHELIDLGFFCALGTSEKVPVLPEDGHVHSVVMLGTPLTWDTNNGVTVFYDEEGRPWIVKNSEVGEVMNLAMRKLIKEFNLRRGAGVPHSNDGGHFVCKVLPMLMSK